MVLLGPLTQAAWYLPGSATPPFEGLPAECQVSTYAAQQQCRGRSEWAFWDATRLVGMDLQDSTITEFPFFTFLFADLHAHMIALPLALAALGLMVALVRTENREPRTGSLPSITGSWFLVLGSLALVVARCGPPTPGISRTYLGLGVLTLALIGWRRVRRGEELAARDLVLGLSSLALVLGSSLLFLPFTRSFATDYAGFELWRGSRTSAVDFLKINGLWLFLLGGAALLLYRRAHRASSLGLALIGAGALALALAQQRLDLSRWCCWCRWPAPRWACSSTSAGRRARACRRGAAHQGA